ncbi:MAG: H-NS family nucleoid-associated regulatory protein [Rhodovibrionaceae bacterium]
MSKNSKSAAEMMKEAKRLMDEAERVAQRELSELKKKWEADAKAAGSTVEEVLGLGGKKSAPRAKSARRSTGVAKYLHPVTKKPVDGRVARGDAAFASYKKGKKLDDAKLSAAGLINPEFLKTPKGKVFAKENKGK